MSLTLHNCSAFHILKRRLTTLPRYGAVVRGQNAYVPPGARRPGAPAPATNNANAAAAPEIGAATKVEVPKVSVNGPDGTAVSAVQAQSPPSSKATSPAPPAGAAPAAGSKVSPTSILSRKCKLQTEILITGLFGFSHVI